MNTKSFSTLALMMLLGVAGCTGDRFSSSFKFPGTEKEKSEVKPIVMAGRWTLTSPNRGQCGMNFTGAPKATEGTVRPEGGCPGNFFTSRSWSQDEEGQILIKDHNGEQLVKLTPAGSGQSLWLEGLAASGERVMLAR
jgi:hypothetical protein